MSLLECKSLVCGYGAHEKKQVRELVAPFDFELSAGEVVSLMGENGCGKSTLLKTMAGLLSPLSGIVTLSGCASSCSARERAKRVALVRMAGAVPDRMTVREFVALGRTPYVGLFAGLSAEDYRIVDESLELLNLMDFSNRWVSELSDGERSRVYLAMAIAQQVKVLLLDEPNAFLDIPRSHHLFKILKNLAAERQMGIVVSTHSVEYAEKYSDRLMVIVDKLVRISKTPEARAKGLLDWTCNDSL